MRSTIEARIPPVAPPAVVSPEAPVVGIPSFLEVTGFDPITDSDTDRGVTVSVTATPVEVRWQFGDHERTCSSAGAGFTEERLDRAMAREDGLVDDGEICTFLFTTSSAKDAGGPLPSSVVTVWDYSWALNGADQGIFNAGVVSPATTFDLTVREYQAVLKD